MKRLFFSALMCCAAGIAAAQTCTVTGTSPLNWVNPGPSCTEGGNAGTKTVIIVPVGFVLNFDSNGDTWTGTQIEIYGTVNVTANPTFNCSFVIHNGGTLNLNGKLSLGASGGCGYNISVKSGGKVDVGGTGSDRLAICGVDIMKGNGACNDCGGTNSGQCAYNNTPYCEPATGFTGPTGYGQTGYDATLPVKLTYFTGQADGDDVVLDWATEKEENFDHFEIERATQDLEFSSIGKITGSGGDVLERYSFRDTNPIVGDNYYRLKAVDINGGSELFNVISINMSGKYAFAVYPNPTNGKNIHYRINFEVGSDDRIVLLNSVGAELQRIRVSDTIGELSFKDELKPGIYMLQYSSDRFKQTVRFSVND